MRRLQHLRALRMVTRASRVPTVEEALPPAPTRILSKPQREWLRQVASVDGAYVAAARHPSLRALAKRGLVVDSAHVRRGRESIAMRNWTVTAAGRALIAAEDEAVA